MVRGRKASCTTAMIVALFVLCWLPYCIYEGTLLLLAPLGLLPSNVLLFKVSRVLYLFTLFNSLIDPFIYALRMREVRRGRSLICQPLINNFS